ncbi:outer membrane beta-barrel protein [Ruegeria sp. AU67]|uniref:outer membrane beta-barrel protein n=1 Tax=Ruegeria sp. AU67 TaxID=2108530 RepID=UPI000D6A02EF|nr:outer membrane beta-barrel protein [Ruegeria sp. AU67]
MGLISMTMRIYVVAMVVAGMCPATSLADKNNNIGAVTQFKKPAVVSAAGVDWTGFSVGLELGYAPDVEDSSGPIYGAKFGWDYDFGKVIVGYFLQYTRTELDIDPGFELGSYTRFGARSGFDSGLNMYYASAGYAELDTHASGDINPGEGRGYFVGLGYERFIREKVTLGAELVYSEYSDFEREFKDLGVATLSFSLNYRF